MYNSKHWFTFLCSFFSVLVIVGNLTYQKFVLTSLLPGIDVELSVGILIYPFTFLLTDLIAEFFGKDNAIFCIRQTLILNLIVAIIIYGMDNMQATLWSTIDDDTFHKVFGFFNVAFIGSVLACYVSQKIDIHIYLWLKRVTKGKLIWVRNIFSTVMSLYIDTLIVTIFLAMFHALPEGKIWNLILNGFLFKSAFSIISSPFYSITVRLVQRRLALKHSLPKIIDSHKELGTV